ncbi:MAG: hypothetical protein JRG93_13180 [Deltaproteobacteria bacterium]|nr:hypothetical protein [Deltaproteobacteria bacterium]
MSFFRVSGVPQKGEARTPLTRKKDITRTKSSPRDTDTDADTDAGTDTVTGADTDADTAAGTGTGTA